MFFLGEERSALATEIKSILRPGTANEGDAQILRKLPVLVIHAHSSCNCRCTMCDIWKTQDAESFTVEDLRAQLPVIRKLETHWVAFSGGEPLLNPEWPELCAILHAENIRTTLLTTGLLLKKYASKVAVSFDDVIISLDGPPDIHDKIRRVPGGFQIIEDGVTTLRELSPQLPIRARCTVQKANYFALLATARAAHAIGLSGISFLAVDMTSTAFNRDLVWPVTRQSEVALTVPELAELEAELDRLVSSPGRDFGPDFVAESPEKLARIANHFRAHLGLAQSEAPRCNAPWVSAVIETDGSVRPCFFHPAIGSLREKDLESVLNGPTAREFRSRLDVATNEICRRCVCSLNYRS